MNNTANHSQVNFLPVMRILQDLAISAELNAVVMGNVELKKQITAEEFGNNIMQIAHVQDVANSNQDKQHKLRVAFKDTRNKVCYDVEETAKPAAAPVYKDPVAILFNAQAGKIGNESPTTLFIANSNIGKRKMRKKAVAPKVRAQKANVQISNASSAGNVIYLSDRRQELAPTG